MAESRAAVVGRGGERGEGQARALIQVRERTGIRVSQINVVARVRPIDVTVHEIELGVLRGVACASIDVDVLRAEQARPKQNGGEREEGCNFCFHRSG